MNKKFDAVGLMLYILIGFLSITVVVLLFLYIPIIVIMILPLLMVVTLEVFLGDRFEKKQSKRHLANYEKIKNEESELFQRKANKMIDDEVCLNCNSSLEIIPSVYSGKEFCRVKCKNCGYDIRRLRNRLILVLNKPRVLLNRTLMKIEDRK